MPPNSLVLSQAGIDHKWNKSSRHLTFRCLCGGTMYLAELHDFKWCMGELSCRAADLELGKVIEGLQPIGNRVGIRRVE